MRNFTKRSGDCSWSWWIERGNDYLNMAGRSTDIKLKPEVKEAGGLGMLVQKDMIPPRVDRPLRGRAGRQGDRGSSQFYVSLEDNLMHTRSKRELLR